MVPLALGGNGHPSPTFLLPVGQPLDCIAANGRRLTRQRVDSPALLVWIDHPHADSRLSLLPDRAAEIPKKSNGAE